MIIYKFRSLITETDFCRLKHIIETGEFWCSRFSDLNDPMEGIFKIKNYSNWIKKISDQFHEKQRYKICSFSGKKGFSNQAMWGYYTSGFKGVAIGVEIKSEDGEIPDKDTNIENIIYDNNLPWVGSTLAKDVKDILLHKNMDWQHENEYRFLKATGQNYCKIGKIKEICFGNPYGNIINGSQVKENSPDFYKYECFKKEIKKIIKTKNAQDVGGDEKKIIKYTDVKITRVNEIKIKVIKVKK